MKLLILSVLVLSFLAISFLIKSNSAVSFHTKSNTATIPRNSDSGKCRSLRRYAKTKDLILTGASIVTLAKGDTTLIENGVIMVCNGIIAFVGDNQQFEALDDKPCRAPTLELSSSDVIVPAFINAHTHAAMALFKNLGNDRALSEWLTNFIFPLEGALVDEEFCRIGAKLAMAEYLASGTSTFADMYFFQNAVAEEVVKVGMRSFLGQSIIDFPQPDSPTPEQSLVIGEEYIRNWVGHELVVPLMSPHAPYTTSRRYYEQAVALNRAYGVRTWTHCSETQDENANFRRHQGFPEDSNITATAWLRDIGVLGPDMTCAHSVWLSDDDVQIYKDTGTSAAHCPSSNLKLASGLMRYTAMNSAGVTISFGTDGHASNNDVDLVEEARLASLIHKANDLNPLTLPALDALKHLTMGGAKAVGREMEQGSIEVGKFADFAIFGGKSVKWTPRYDIGMNGSMSVEDTAAGITYNSNAYDVRGTVVNGRVLYFDRCYTTMDIDEVLGDADRVAQKIRDSLAALAQGM